jgi:hypothetical protein
MPPPTFERYIGVDYSGAETPKSSLKGLRVYAADWLNTPQEVEPPPSSRKYWTRRGIAEWLDERLARTRKIPLGCGENRNRELGMEKHPAVALSRQLETAAKLVGASAATQARV